MAGYADPLMRAIANRLDMAWVDGPSEARLLGLRGGDVAAGWVCGLLHAEQPAAAPGPMRAVVAPVMAANRYADRPIYYGDVIVGRRCAAQSLKDLAGKTLVYNEATSLSGYRMLIDRLGSLDLFAATVASGSHAESISMVASGRADTACIDSILLDMMRWRGDTPAGVRVVASLGPYPAPPIVVHDRIDAEVMRAALVTWHLTPAGSRMLSAWGVRRLARVDDAAYAPLVATAYHEGGHAPGP